MQLLRIVLLNSESELLLLQSVGNRCKYLHCLILPLHSATEDVREKVHMHMHNMSEVLFGAPMHSAT